ncbi:C-C motif chemokine 20-like [Thalassophryne amazonica]|uniref:C-C motif chemokine 20-like n=1 Tax=Thalassophryne amazonica TaxID=390379 RepID=UPI00147249F6|nr:C-C motif chemokine 20-like [Thalassophryne amazonica]
MASPLSAVLLLVIICAASAAAKVPADCCLQVSDKHLPPKAVAAYFLQEPGHGCSIRAAVLITKAGRKLCVPHPSDRKWVSRIVSLLDKTQET